MNAPLVSIITPTYNQEKYIEQCIDSVLRQSFTDWEMIIINDGSPDQTAGIIEKYAATDPRIRIVNQENIGVFRLSETYNKGLSLSRGKYIAVLEGDDTWEPDKLERQVGALEKDETIVLAWGIAKRVSHDETIVYDEIPVLGHEPGFYNNIPPGSILDLYMLGQAIPAVTIVIRKNILEKIGGFIQRPDLPLVDFTTVLALSLHGKFYFDDHVLGMWRIYSTQTTKKHTVAIYLGIKSFLEEHVPKISSMNPRKSAVILDRYDQLCLVAYARSGRYKLIRKEFKSARQDYIKAIIYPAKGNMIWRFRSLVGYVMSLFHLDVEWMAKLIGKKTYSDK